MSLWFVLAAARRRVPRKAWLVLLRRLFVLCSSGSSSRSSTEATSSPSTASWTDRPPLALFLPRRVLPGAGLVATAAAYALFGAGEPTTFGLITAGAGAAACGLPSRLERAGRGVVVAFLLSLAVIAVQSLVSRMWLRQFHHGPVEGL